MVGKRVVYFSLLILVLLLLPVEGLEARTIACETLTIWAFVPPRIEVGFDQYGLPYCYSNLDTAHIELFQNNDEWQIVNVIAI